jgi:hypothetical protein
MTVDNADDLVPFQDVKVIRSTAQALLCGIGSKHVWLPRGHISGKLWCTGDRGTLFVRRWVAHDRGLIAQPWTDAVSPAEPSISRRRVPGRLYLVRGDRDAHLAR